MATGRNLSFSWAWQSAWGVPADAAADAWTFNAALGDLGPQGVQPQDATPLMGLDGAEVDPVPGAHDVSHQWRLPVCARQAGLWLHGLMGATSSSAAVGSRGGFLFAVQPAANDTITVGATTFTFVSGTPGAGEVEIGASLLATVANAATAVDGEAAISASARGQLLWIEHDTADATGNTVVTQSSAPSKVRPLAATLAGGGERKHVWASEANVARPFATVEADQSDAVGAFRFRVVDSMMVRGLGLTKMRAGPAEMTADVLARYADWKAARTLDATPIELAPRRFANAAGALFLNDACIGAIEEASVTLGVGLEPGAMNACGVSPEGVIGEPAVGDTSALVTVTARFPDAVLAAAANAGSTVSAELAFLSPATGAAMFVEVPRVILDRRPALSAQGRGQVLGRFTGTGLVDPATGARYRVTLHSPVAGWPAA